MSLFGIGLEVRRYWDRWTDTLETLTSGLDKDTQLFLRNKNKERPGLGAVGYGAELFARLFNIGIDEKAALANSAIVFMCGCIDDVIDQTPIKNQEAEEQLNNAYNFLVSGEGFDNLQIFRRYLESVIPKNQLEQVLQTLHAYKEAAIEELHASTYRGIHDARVRIGSTHSDVVGTLIGIFGERELSESERTVLKHYSIGGTLLDSAADYYQDRHYGEETLIDYTMREKGQNRREALAHAFAEACENFAFASSFLNEGQQELYKDITSIAKIFYCMTFLRKGLKYGILH